MIADAVFGPPGNGVRTLRFVARPSIPIEAACLVANGIRETLRELFGESCELALGEPAAIDREAWQLLARDALLFLTRGRQTDIVLVIPSYDARRLVLRAFGEGEPLPDGACSALELHAIERIAARCAASFEPLCAERTATSRAVVAAEIPPCVAYFDLRVHAPLALTLGIAIVRDLPDPGPSGRLSPRALDRVGVPLRVILGEGTIGAGALLALRPGALVPLRTSLDEPARLVAGARTVALGVAGTRGARAAFAVAGTAAGR
jgi:flagellar motor switch/type III secretory pathway protein FliN